MNRKVFVPMTLENVGNEGKILTDNTVLKIGGSVLASMLIAALFCQKITPWLPKFINLYIGITITVLLSIKLSRIFALKEKYLKDMVYNMKKHKTTNVGDLSDIYEVLEGGVCLHDSGHISIMVEIVRGSTVGATVEEINSYLDCIKSFEDRINRENFILKHFNIEVKNKDYDLFRQQKIRCMENGMKNLEANLDIKNKYLRTFMDNCVRDERDIYVIISQFSDLELFKMKINQFINSLKNKIILESSIVKDKEELREFGKQFHNVDMFEIESIDEEDLDEIIHFK